MTSSTTLPDLPTAKSDRHLGVTGLSVHYIASVLGAGILILPGLALDVAGPGSILAWMFLIGFSYAFAWVIVMLSVRYPSRKGVTLFLRHAFGPAWERGAGLLLALVIAGGIVPVYSIAAARRIVALGVVPAGWSPNLIAFLIVVAALGMGLAGLRLGARVQIALVTTVGAVLLLAVCLALPHADPANLSAPVPAGWHGIGMAIALCFFGVIGWDNAASLAEDVRDPARTMPGAAMLAVTAVGLLYLAFAITLVLTGPTAGRTRPFRPSAPCSPRQRGTTATASGASSASR
jgi:amino acid efflux transporter